MLTSRSFVHLFISTIINSSSETSKWLPWMFILALWSNKHHCLVILASFQGNSVWICFMVYNNCAKYYYNFSFFFWGNMTKFFIFYFFLSPHIADCSLNHCYLNHSAESTRWQCYNENCSYIVHFIRVVSENFFKCTRLVTWRLKIILMSLHHCFVQKYHYYCSAVN